MTARVLYDEPGPRTRRRIRIASAISLVVVGLAVAWVVLRLWDAGQFDGERWEIFTEGDTARFLWEGLLVTLRLAVVSIAFASTLGLLLALGRVAERRWIRWPVGVWIEVFRAIPLLALIVFAYLGLPKYDIRISGFWCVVLGLTLYNSAALAEIFRAGILSLEKGQWEAAATLGLRWPSTMRLVILPQALRRMLPSYVSQVVTIVKDTSLGFIVAAEEFLSRSRIVGNFRGGRYLVPALLTAALVYLIINLALSRLAHRLEGRVGRKAGGVLAIDPELALAGPEPMTDRALAAEAEASLVKGPTDGPRDGAP
jgi:glutamate transport system permease protein